jgi:hypothetical protein
MVKEKYDGTWSKKKENRRSRTTFRIGVHTAYAFTGTNMSPFGGLFAAGCFVEKLHLEKQLRDTLTIERRTELDPWRYLIAIIHMLYIGYERFAHIQYLKDDAMFKRLLGITTVPVQSSFWRFLNESLGAHNEDQLRSVNFDLQEQVWRTGNIGLRKIHVDTDTTVETVYGEQENATVGYNPKHRGKRSYQPVLSTIAETGELICARQRSGDTISGEEIAQHLDDVFAHVQAVETVISRLDSGFYCKEAIEKHEQYDIRFILAVKKQAPIQQEIAQVRWKKTRIADGIAEFMYQPHMWSKSYRFIVTRYRKQEQDVQTDMFEDIAYRYRVFVTDLKRNAEKVVQEYDGRAGIESLIEESKNQIAFAKIPGNSFVANANFLQLVVLAFNINKWMQLIGRIEDATYHWEEIKTSRFKHLYIASKIAKSGHKTVIRFAADYPYQEYFNRLMNRLRRIVWEPGRISRVIERSLIAGVT